LQYPAIFVLPAPVYCAFAMFFVFNTLSCCIRRYLFYRRGLVAPYAVLLYQTTLSLCLFIKLVDELRGGAPVVCVNRYY
jgi:hypothetical protein